MACWSTDTVRERERFSYWRDIVCRALFNVSAEAPPGSFKGQMSVRGSGGLRFLMSESSSYRFVRRDRNITSASADCYTILMQLHGHTTIEGRTNSFVVCANDAAIFDGRQTFNACNSESGRRVVAVVPRTMIDWRAPWLGRHPLLKLGSNVRFADLARRHVVHLASSELNETQTYLLAENLCNLVALASAPDIPPNQLQSELQLEALLAFSRQNLHHSRLSPQFVAGKCGISVRTLHLRFKMLGQSFGDWLLENRLDSVGKALKDPQQRARRISEIAYSSGFNDLSHFNKSFRARFGMTPGEWRIED